MILAVRDNERRGDPLLGPTAPTNTAPKASGMIFFFFFFYVAQKHPAHRLCLISPSEVHAGK